MRSDVRQMGDICVLRIICKFKCISSNAFFLYICGRGQCQLKKFIAQAQLPAWCCQIWMIVKRHSRGVHGMSFHHNNNKNEIVASYGSVFILCCVKTNSLFYLKFDENVWSRLSGRFDKKYKKYIRRRNSDCVRWHKVKRKKSNTNWSQSVSTHINTQFRFWIRKFRISAHKLVLKASSKYLRQSLGDSPEHEMRVPQIDSETLKMVVEFSIAVH